MRLAVKQGQEELIAAETQLAHQEKEIRAIERRLRFRLGRSLDRLAELEEQIDQYGRQIQQLRIPGAYEAGYLPVEEQYRQTWQRSSETDIYAGAEPLNPADERQLKRLYRRLARRYHPDLAADEEEQQVRTKKMAALNEAYAAGSLVELIALSAGGEELNDLDRDSAEAEVAQVLEKELGRIQRKLFLINNAIENLHNHPVVQLSLDIKLARRRGRDLLEEMSLDLERRIVRATGKRDELKDRLDRLQR
ncbi:MAG: DnaJ domain-containing protein [Chloroflexota bacterium]